MFKKNIFDYSLVVVTILPLLTIIPLYFNIQSMVFLYFTIISLGSTHVFATVYLLYDKDVQQFIKKEPINFILIPAFLIFFTIFIFINTPNQYFIIVLLIFIFNQSDHYGNQNTGVLAFSSLSNRGISINKFERVTLKLGILCGLLGTYKMLHPSLLAPSKIFLYNTEYIDKIFLPLYDIGKFSYLLLGIISIIYAIIYLRKYPTFFVLYLCSVLFFTPIYFIERELVAFFVIATAHGLQYLVFLITHGGNKKTNPLLNILLLSIIVFIGYLIWHKSGIFFSNFSNNEMLINKYAISIIFGLTFAHFWFDQNLWKLRISNRRDWIKKNYDFIFNKNHG